MLEEPVEYGRSFTVNLKLNTALCTVYLVTSDMHVSYMLVVTLQFELIAGGNEKVRLWMPRYDWLILRQCWCGGGGEHFLTWTSSIVLRVFNFKVRIRFASFSHTPKHSGAAGALWMGGHYHPEKVAPIRMEMFHCRLKVITQNNFVLIWLYVNRSGSKPCKKNVPYSLKESRDRLTAGVKGSALSFKLYSFVAAELEYWQKLSWFAN